MPLLDPLSGQPPIVRLFAYPLTGLFGLFAAIVGASWFIAGKGTLLKDFPADLAEAVACTAGGITVAAWSVLRLQREIRRARARPPAR